MKVKISPLRKPEKTEAPEVKLTLSMREALALRIILGNTVPSTQSGICWGELEAALRFAFPRESHILGQVSGMLRDALQKKHGSRDLAWFNIENVPSLVDQIMDEQNYA